MPSATIATTVATGIRSPRMQATPPIFPGSTVILSKAMSWIVREAARGSSGESGGASGCDTNHVLDLIGGNAGSTTSLGSWYATVLFWRPQVPLFVNEATLLPVLVPLAPASSLLARFPTAVEAVFGRHGVIQSFIEAEIAQMAERRVATTKNRSVVGIMNEFTHLGEAFREKTASFDLEALSIHLSEVPCSPLYSRQISPDRELKATAAQHLRVTGVTERGLS